MKDIYSRLDLMTVIWWLVLILVFLIVPIVKMNGVEMTCLKGETLEPTWWVYVLGIFIYDVVAIMFIIAFSMIGMMLAKLHNILSKG